MKNVPVYFYYLDVTYSRSPSNSKEYTFNDFLSDFNTFLNDLIAKDLIDIKYDFHIDEKIIWIDSISDLSNGNYDIIFKTAKYNHRRDVIDIFDFIIGRIFCLQCDQNCLFEIYV